MESHQNNCLGKNHSDMIFQILRIMCKLKYLCTDPQNSLEDLYY